MENLLKETLPLVKGKSSDKSINMAELMVLIRATGQERLTNRPIRDWIPLGRHKVPAGRSRNNEIPS